MFAEHCNKTTTSMYYLLYALPIFKWK